MSTISGRREWLKQSALAALGMSFSMNSLAGEDYLPKYFGSEAGLVNLGSNENPYGLAPAAIMAMSHLATSANRYQFNIPALKDFKKQLADHYGVAEENILVTPGSGEALNLVLVQASVCAVTGTSGHLRQCLHNANNLLLG